VLLLSIKIALLYLTVYFISGGNQSDHRPAANRTYIVFLSKQMSNFTEKSWSRRCSNCSKGFLYHLLAYTTPFLTRKALLGLHHIMLYKWNLTMSRIWTLVVIGTDSISSYQSNYHTIKAIPNICIAMQCQILVQTRSSYLFLNF
jgi:hypothetical protein